MNKLLNVLALATCGVAALSLSVSTAQAQDWPTDDVRLIVPYAPGGTTDVLSRRVANLLQEELNANVVVENRPGAGSTVATGRLARGGRDVDHTIMMASPGHAIGAAIYPNLTYDPVEDFVFIQNLIDIPNVMVVPADSPYNNVLEFVEAAKEQNMTFSHSGVGSSIHMSGELFKTLTGTNMTAVPFAGSGAALPALLGGDVDVSLALAVRGGARIFARGARARPRGCVIQGALRRVHLRGVRDVLEMVELLDPEGDGTGSPRATGRGDGGVFERVHIVQPRRRAAPLLLARVDGPYR